MGIQLGITNLVWTNIIYHSALFRFRSKINGVLIVKEDTRHYHEIRGSKTSHVTEYKKQQREAYIASKWFDQIMITKTMSVGTGGLVGPVSLMWSLYAGLF